MNLESVLVMPWFHGKGRKSFKLGRGMLGSYLPEGQLKGRHRVVQVLGSFSLLSQSLHGCEAGDC